MNTSSFRRIVLTRLPLAVALLLTLLIPSNIGVAQTGGSNQPTPNVVICPNCCYSECSTGTWYPRLFVCAPGGNGSCMSCETRCGPYYPEPQPVPQ